MGYLPLSEKMSPNRDSYKNDSYKTNGVLEGHPDGNHQKESGVTIRESISFTVYKTTCLT